LRSSCLPVLRQPETAAKTSRRMIFASAALRLRAAARSRINLSHDVSGGQATPSAPARPGPCGPWTHACHALRARSCVEGSLEPAGSFPERIRDSKYDLRELCPRIFFYTVGLRTRLHHDLRRNLATRQDGLVEESFWRVRICRRLSARSVRPRASARSRFLRRQWFCQTDVQNSFCHP